MVGYKSETETASTIEIRPRSLGDRVREQMNVGGSDCS